LQTDGRKRYH